MLHWADARTWIQDRAKWTTLIGAGVAVALVNLGLLYNYYLNPKPKPLAGHQKAINAVAACSEKRIIASASDDNSLRIWRYSHKRELKIIRGHTGAVLTTDIRPGDYRQVASGSRDHTIKLWDFDSGIEVRTLRGHQKDVSAIHFTPDGAMLVSAAGDDTIRFWNPDDGSQVGIIKATHGARRLQCDPTGRIVAAGGWQHVISLWDIDTKKELVVLQGHRDYVGALSFRSDGAYLASASRDRTARVWDVQRGTEYCVLPHESIVHGVAFISDRRLATACADKEIRVWDIHRGEEIRRLVGHPSEILCLVYPPNGPLISGGWKSTLMVWRGVR